MIYRRTYLVAGLLAALKVAVLHGATITWTNTSGGLWSVPANWSTHTLPGTSDTALITAVGSYTVTIDTNVAIFGLTLGGATGQQTLTNNNQTLAITNTLVAANGIFDFGGGTLSGGPLTDQGTLNLSGGTVQVPVTVTANGLLSFNGAGVNIFSPLTNSGTINWSSGAITVANNTNTYTGAVHNQTGAFFNIQCDQALYIDFGFEFFSNAGTVRKTAILGASTFYLAFTNNGTVDAQSGTIQFNGNGNIGGSYNTASGAIIQFAGGNYVETGTVTNTGSGLFRQYGATVTLNDRITKFILASGNVFLSPTFQGSGAIQNLQLDGATLVGTNRVTGTLGINGGALAAASPPLIPPSPLTVMASGVLDFNGASVAINSPLTNYGTINWSGGSLTVTDNTNTYTGAIHNQPGALFDIQCDQVLYNNFGFEFFSNAGTVRKTAGLGATTFYPAFTNNGTVDAQSGTIQFNGNGNIGGSYNTASGAIVQFAGGNYVETGTVTVTGSGLCRESGGMVTLNDNIANFVLAGGNVALSPTFQTNGTIYNLQLDGANLTGANKVTGTLGMDGGSLPVGSPLTVASNGVLNFNGAAVAINSPLTNYGTINWSGGSLTVTDNPNTYTGAIHNQPGALFDIQCDQVLYNNFGFEFFSNAGTVRKTAGLGATTFYPAFTNNGTVAAQSGTIQFNGNGNIGGSYNTASGAIIQFAGGNYVETGTVTVTGSGLCRESGGTVTLNDKIANFVLASGNVVLSPTFQTNGAIYNLQLDGATLFGAYRVTGTLTMNGGGLAYGSTTPPVIPPSPLTVSAFGVLNFNGASVAINSPLTNFGTINWNSGSVTVANNALGYTGAIINQSGGLFNLQCDQTLYTAGDGFEFFSNSGTVRKNAGLATTTINLPFANSGTLDAQSGTIRIAGPYMQTGGTMNFGITSLAYFGQIAFSAGAPFTDTLSVNFNDGYYPSAGDSFPLVTYASRSGIFTNLALPSVAQWQTNYSATTFTLSVLSVIGGGPPVTLTPISYASGQFTLQINGSVGPTYVLLASTNFINWTALNTNTPSVMPFTVMDTNAGKFNHRFYRALVGP